MGAVVGRQTFSATGQYLLVEAGTGYGQGGWQIAVVGASWTGSGVLKQRTSPPGSAVALGSAITYYLVNDGSSATAALTAAANVIVQDVGSDLYFDYTHTSGTVTVTVMAAGELIGSEEGLLPSFNPAFTGKVSSVTALATPSAFAATQGSFFASTVSGAVLMGYGTTGDVTLKNRAGTDVLYVGPNTTTTFLGGSLNLALGTPAISPINLEGMTLANNTNAIRGASVNPTRASGWTSFSGTISTAPAQCYSDYRELHTTGTAEVLGYGLFPYMDSGASCASMFAVQAIAYVSTGATVATAAGAAGTGIFALTGKTVIDGATFHASGVAAAAFLSFQANVTDVQALDTSMINMEVASGGINAIIKFQCSAAKGATYFVNFENNGEPAEKTTAKTTAVNDVVGNIAVLIGDQVGYINLHSAKAT